MCSDAENVSLGRNSQRLFSYVSWWEIPSAWNKQFNTKNKKLKTLAFYFPIQLFHSPFFCCYFPIAARCFNRFRIVCHFRGKFHVELTLISACIRSPRASIHNTFTIHIYTVLANTCIAAFGTVHKWKLFVCAQMRQWKLPFRMHMHDSFRNYSVIHKCWMNIMKRAIEKKTPKNQTNELFSAIVAMAYRKR